MEKELAKVFLIISDNQKVLMKDFKPSEEDWTEHTLTFDSVDFNIEDYINDTGRLKIKVYFGDYLDKSFSLCGTKVLEVITNGNEIICKTYSRGMAYSCHDRPEEDTTGVASEIPTVINYEWKPDDEKLTVVNCDGNIENLKLQIHAQNPKITGINIHSVSGHRMEMTDTV